MTAVLTCGPTLLYLGNCDVTRLFHVLSQINNLYSQTSAKGCFLKGEKAQVFLSAISKYATLLVIWKV